MSLFLEADEEKLRAADEQNYTMSYPSTPASFSTTQSGDDMFDSPWPTMPTSTDESSNASYPSVTQPMTWPSDSSMSFTSTGPSNQPTFVDSSLAPSIGTWQYSMPSATNGLNARNDSLMQDFYPQSAFVPSQPITTWDTFQSVAPSFRPACEMSSGRSDYSISSQTSGIASSSPYAHSDGCYPTTHSPMIKTEDNYDQSYSIPDAMSTHTEHVHVNPGDIYSPPDVEVKSQATTPSPVPVKVEEDAKPVMHSQPAGGHRAVSLENIRESFERQKRGYTTPLNAVCSCSTCGKLFQRTSNLKAHLDTHKPNREQPFACDFYGCTRRFVRKTDMNRHQESVHIKSRNFHCMLCFGSFARKDTLRRHVDDGCPRRSEYKRHLARGRRASSLRTTSHQCSGDFTGDFVVPKIEP